MKFSKVGCEVLEKKLVLFLAVLRQVLYSRHILLHTCVGEYVRFFGASYLKKTEGVWRVVRNTQQSRKPERIKFYLKKKKRKRQQIMKT